MAALQADAAAMTLLDGTIHRVRFTNPESGFSVISVEAANHEIVAAVGVMASPNPGEKVRLHGVWFDDPRWGRQFKFETYEPQLPQNADEAEAYLKGGRIPGVGPSTAKAIVAHFGDDTLLILDEDIERLTEVPGIGPKKRDAIIGGWKATAQMRAIGIALTSVGASAGLAGPIFEAFGADGAALVTENPYLLTRAKRVGFTTADQIAVGKLGWDRSDPRRLSAGLAHALEAAEGEGHCFLPVAELIETATELLEASAGVVAGAVSTAVDEERIIIDGADRAWTARMDYLERDLASQIKRIAAAPLRMPTAKQRAQIAKLAARKLTEQQQQVVQAVADNAITVLTGGPGVGKSHTVATVAEAAGQLRWQIAMCAPTGRAARRMSELADGAPAMTVHRLIRLIPTDDNSGDDVDQDAPDGADGFVNADLIVVDESSMLDVSLARNLLRRVRTGTRLLIVGDTDQLPSVGPGAVLADLIASGIAATVELTQIFRQAQESGIVQVAHQINRGEQPELRGWEDLFFWSRPTPEATAEAVVAMVCERIGAKFETDPDLKPIDPSEIQVLVPQRGGSAGMNTLNRLLQDRINPGDGTEYEVTAGGETTVFRPGDRAMIVQNNYDKGEAGVFNGTPVRVIGVNPEPGKDEAAVTVETDDGEIVEYAASEVGQLALAYAITIHKSQGSQYRCVVIPVTKQAWRMLARNLIYTGITRAQQFVVLIGQEEAFGKAVRTQNATVRHTSLDERLRA